MSACGALHQCVRVLFQSMVFSWKYCWQTIVVKQWILLLFFTQLLIVTVSLIRHGMQSACNTLQMALYAWTFTWSFLLVVFKSESAFKSCRVFLPIFTEEEKKRETSFGSRWSPCWVVKIRINPHWMGPIHLVDFAVWGGHTQYLTDGYNVMADRCIKNNTKLSELYKAVQR